MARDMSFEKSSKNLIPYYLPDDIIFSGYKSPSKRKAFE